MIRIALIAAALALPAGEAFAGQHVSAVPGAIAGRSPHQAYRPAAPLSASSSAQLACASVAAPAPHAGRLATPVATRSEPGCGAVRLAETEGARTTGRD